MTRIIFLGFPIIMTYIVLKLKNEHYLIACVCFLLSIPQMYFFHIIPNNILLWNPDNNWYPEFGSTAYALNWGIYFLVCFSLVKVLSFFLNKT
jgi:hypothetical protein